MFLLHSLCIFSLFQGLFRIAGMASKVKKLKVGAEKGDFLW